MVPLPETVKLEPVPNIAAAAVLVPLVSPENGNAVAVMVPLPVGPKDAPVPTNIAAWVFVPFVIVLNAALPAVPPLVPHAKACVLVL